MEWLALRGKSEDEAAVAKRKKRALHTSWLYSLFLSLSFPSHFYMKMRNPLKPKNKARRFAELQEDQGFSDAQFETPETPSMFISDLYNN